MGSADSLLDQAENQSRSAQRPLPSASDGVLSDVVVAGLFIAAAFFLLMENNLILFGVFFLAFLFAFHPAHAQFRLRKYLGPI